MFLNYLNLVNSGLDSLGIVKSDYPQMIQQLKDLRKNSSSQKQPIQNDRILQVLQRQNVDRPPIWIMRQAGRYLPEFMSLSKDFTFFQKCENPFLATEITLQPVHRFHLDAAIIFSDILVIPKAMGMKVEMQEKRGPVLPEPLVNPSDIQKLVIPQGDELDHVYDAVFLTKACLKNRIPLIGFCGAPWTIFTYMTEGGSSKTFSKAKKWIYNYPEESKKVLSMVADISGDYLQKKIEAGADLVQIFDSWASELTHDDYRNFSLQFSVKIAKKVKSKYPNTPIIIFAKGQWTCIEDIFSCEYFDCVSLDSTGDIKKIHELAKKYNKVVQGNLDPGLILAPQPLIIERTKEMVEQFKGLNHIANLAHGLWPEHPVENVKCFIESVTGLKHDQ